MVRNANRRRRQLVSRRLSMTPLTVAATLLGMSELALAGDGAVDATRPHPGNGASQVLLKKMEAMEQRIKSLESQLKQKDTPPSRTKAAQETPADGKPRGKANRTLDLAAAPAGDPVADQTPPPGKAQTPGQAPPAGQTAAPDQVAKSAQSAKSAKPIDWEKAGDKGQGDPRHDGFAGSGSRDRRLWRVQVRLRRIPPRTASGRSAPTPPSGAAADLRSSPTTSSSTPRSSSSMPAPASTPTTSCTAPPRLSRFAIDFKIVRPVQLALPRHRPHSDRLHQPAPRADDVLQRQPARTLQWPDPVDLDGAGGQRLTAGSPRASATRCRSAAASRISATISRPRTDANTVPRSGGPMRRDHGCTGSASPAGARRLPPAQQRPGARRGKLGYHAPRPYRAWPAA